MTTDTMPPGAHLWDRLMEPEGTLLPEVARYFLRLKFSEKAQQRMDELAIKAQEGTLSAEEEREIDGCLRMGSLLALLQSKARVALKQAGEEP